MITTKTYAEVWFNAHTQEQLWDHLMKTEIFSVHPVCKTAVA